MRKVQSEKRERPVHACVRGLVPLFGVCLTFMSLIFEIATSSFLFSADGRASALSWSISAWQLMAPV